MKKIAVLGAGGMVGHKICQQLSDHHVVGFVRRPVAEYEEFREIFVGVELRGDIDVLSGSALEDALRDVRPDVVINAVGLVKQLEAAADPFLAIAINALLPHRLARLSEEVGARLIHFSTDCVFDGSRGGYSEEDVPDATDLYGRSKALGETTEAEPRAVTLRTSFIGRELSQAKHGLLEWFLSRVGGRVDGYAKVIYGGLTTLEVARIVGLLVKRCPELSGVFHLAAEAISKYDLLNLIKGVFGLDIEIRRVDEPVLDRSLSMNKFRAATGYRAPDWPTMIHALHDDPTPYDSSRP